MNRMNDLNCLLAEKLVEDIKKDHEASGIAVAIIDKSGKTQYEKFWGVRDLESGKEVNGDTIFGLASVTKSFTALSIMQLEEKGIIDLDAPISQYIPEFTNKNQSKKVTVRHLLSHAGGFFPLPRILVGNVAESLGLDEEKDGDFAYNDAVAQEGVKLVAERLDAQTDELIETDPTAFYTAEEYEEAKDTLWQVLQLRAESVLGQLDGTIPSTDDGQKEAQDTLIDGSAIDLSVMGEFNH